MSPRRSSHGGEDSILAMLERDPTRRPGTGATTGRLAWYGAGTAVVLALTGTLVWLAANNDGLRPEVQETVLAEAGAVPASPAGATVRQVALAPAPVPAAADPAPALRPGSAAVIVDQAPPADGVPPLRLLKPVPANPSKPAAQAPAPGRTASRAATASPAAPPVPIPAEAKSAPRPAAAPARPRPVTVAKGPGRQAQARAQRGATPARSADTAVDADVALITAVITHANGHAPEGSQMTELLCPNDSCKGRPARD